LSWVRLTDPARPVALEWLMPRSTKNSPGPVVGGFLEAFSLFKFWILAVLFFAWFFAASLLSSKPLRILLFWTPVTSISILGLGTFSYLHS
jgi:hypothetical protein